MKSDKLSKRVDDLGRLLETMAELQQALGDVSSSRLEAIRRADVGAMNGLLEQESDLAQKLQERSGLRRQLMDAIASELGNVDSPGRALTLSQLARGLPGASADRLIGAGHALRDACLRTAQITRVTTGAVREVLHHLQWVMAAVRPAAKTAPTYSAAGSCVVVVDPPLLDATC